MQEAGRRVARPLQALPRPQPRPPPSQLPRLGLSIQEEQGAPGEAAGTTTPSRLCAGSPRCGPMKTKELARPFGPQAERGQRAPGSLARGMRVGPRRGTLRAHWLMGVRVVPRKGALLVYWLRDVRAGLMEGPLRPHWLRHWGGAPREGAPGSLARGAGRGSEGALCSHWLEGRGSGGRALMLRSWREPELEPASGR